MCITTDELMVIITSIYVVATIFIMIANNRSAKATRDQVEVSQRQFEETKRLEVMPSLSVSIKVKGNGNFGWGKYPHRFISDVPQSKNSHQELETEYYLLYLKNVGNGSARNVKLKLGNETDESTCIGTILVGETVEVYCEFTGVFAYKDQGGTSIELMNNYCDLLENKYQQTTFLTLNRDDLSYDTANYGISDIKLLKK